MKALKIFGIAALLNCSLGFGQNIYCPHSFKCYNQECIAEPIMNSDFTLEIQSAPLPVGKTEYSFVAAWSNKLNNLQCEYGTADGSTGLIILKTTKLLIADAKTTTTNNWRNMGSDSYYCQPNASFPYTGDPRNCPFLPNL